MFRTRAINEQRLDHELKAVQVMLKLQSQGFKVDRVTEPSSVDVLAWREGIIRFIEVKAGKSKALTENEKAIKKLIESNPRLTYEIF